MASSAPKARVKEQPLGDEEASAVLKLGEFTGVHALTLSEARLVINIVQNTRKAKQQKEVKESEVLVKTQEYLETFARFKQNESIEAVENLLMAQSNLDSFERAQLGSLCCESAEEAKTLVPSLANKKSDIDLQELLDSISKLRNYVET